MRNKDKPSFDDRCRRAFDLKQKQEAHLLYARDHSRVNWEEFVRPALGIVGRVTDCRVRGLGYKSPGSILTSRTETRSLSPVVIDGFDPCSVPLSGEKESHAVESSTWLLNNHNCSENYPKTKLNES